MEKNEHASSTIEGMCKHCLSAFRDHCTKKEDTKPRDCRLLFYYLDLARKELIPPYQALIQYDEMRFTYFLAKDGVVVGEYDHPKALLGEIILRKMSPEWFDDGGFIKNLS